MVTCQSPMLWLDLLGLEQTRISRKLLQNQPSDPVSNFRFLIPNAAEKEQLVGKALNIFKEGTVLPLGDVVLTKHFATQFAQSVINPSRYRQTAYTGIDSGLETGIHKFAWFWYFVFPAVVVPHFHIPSPTLAGTPTADTGTDFVL